MLIAKNPTVNAFVTSTASAIQAGGQTSAVKDGVWEGLPCLWGAGADTGLSARHRPSADPPGRGSSNKVALPLCHCPGHCKKKTTGKEHLSHWHKEAVIHKGYLGRIRGKARMEHLMAAFAPKKTVSVLCTWVNWGQFLPGEIVTK